VRDYVILKIPLRRVLGNTVVLYTRTLRRIRHSSESGRVRTATNGACSKTMGKYA